MKKKLSLLIEILVDITPFLLVIACFLNLAAAILNKNMFSLGVAGIFAVLAIVFKMGL